MSRIYIGSTDMLSPSDRETDPIEAYDKYLTIYDHNAKVFTEHLAKVDHYVIRAELGEGGIITFEISDSIRIEIFPAASGPVEGWRLFAKGSDVHYVYPEWADRD
jgi:hypothetical protein